MEKETIEILKKEYAHLLVNFGLNLKKGSLVEIEIPTDDIPFTRMLVEECYKAGAKRVIIKYIDDYINRLHYLYGDKNELSKIYEYQKERLKLYVKENSPVLVGFTHHYDSNEGLDLTKVEYIRQQRSKVTIDLKTRHMFNCQWSGFAIPSKSWSMKLFPNLSSEDAINKFWEVIFKCCHIEKNKSIDNWVQHDALLKKRARYLDSLKIKSLHYRNALGTDLYIELMPNTRFIGGTHSVNNVSFNPNFPTEEVFTCPHKDKTNGIVYSSKPLIVDDIVIEDFYLKFKDGKVVELHAKKGEEKLKNLVFLDEGSTKLGEVALVPFSSPINASGILFSDSLYDENACCHLAIGVGFPLVFNDYTKVDVKKLYERGLNNSIIHIDFMIGTSDLNITATTFDDKKVIIFKDGEWAE